MLLIDNNVYVLYGLPGIEKITLINNADNIKLHNLQYAIALQPNRFRPMQT